MFAMFGKATHCRPEVFAQQAPFADLLLSSLHSAACMRVSGLVYQNYPTVHNEL